MDGMRDRAPATRPSCIAADVASAERSSGVRDGILIPFFL